MYCIHSNTSSLHFFFFVRVGAHLYVFALHFFVVRTSMYCFFFVIAFFLLSASLITVVPPSLVLGVSHENIIYVVIFFHIYVHRETDVILTHRVADHERLRTLLH